MKNKSFINPKLFIGGLFGFIGAVFAAIGILLYIFGDASHTSGSFRDPKQNFAMLCGTFTIMGLLFFFAGGALFVKELRLTMRKKGLVETGRKIYAVVTGICEDKTIEINNRHPHYAVCEYEDPYTGEKQFFDTRSYTADISNTIGATVAVYIDQNNPELYYVDFDPESIVVKY